MKWVILNDENVIVDVKDSLDGSETNYAKIVDDNYCIKGWILDGVEPKPPKWTSYEFLLRLTAQERADIRQRAITDPNVADFLMLAQSAQEIISNDPITLMGMNYLVYIGVFTEQRKKEILQILE